MKGTPDAPACGFSARTVAMLQDLQAPFAAVDILPDPRIREELTAISQWPTIPQLFVKGELVGGCDIATEMYESGELAQTLGVEADGERELPRRERGGRGIGAYADREPARLSGRQSVGAAPRSVYGDVPHAPAGAVASTTGCQRPSR